MAGLVLFYAAIEDSIISLAITVAVIIGVPAWAIWDALQDR